MVCTIEFATPEYDEAVALRHIVLRQPLGMHYTPEQLAAEWNQIHIAAFNREGRITGYLNLTPLDAETVKMRQVAVAPELQGQGIGAEMVHFSEIMARQLHFREIALHARKTAVPFYLKLGYEQTGSEFEEVSLPHYKMFKHLNR